MAAEFYQVPPWVLLEQDGAPAWIEMAMQMLAARQHAAKVRNQRPKGIGR